jgi:hypothetical protein
MKKRIKIISIIIISLIFLITFLVVLNHFYPGKIFPIKIKISYLSESTIDKISDKSGFLFSSDWLIVKDDDVLNGAIKRGYEIPNVTFNFHYIILSKYKIENLSYLNYIDECSGYPAGLITFDYAKSEKNKYYVYLMEPITLSQCTP